MPMYKPKDSKDVFNIMAEYCKDKKYNFTEKELMYMAEDCYLLFESRSWKGISYWPAVAQRWVLNNLSKPKPYTKGERYPAKQTPEQGQTVRDKLLENRQHDM